MGRGCLGARDLMLLLGYCAEPGFVEKLASSEPDNYTRGKTQIYLGANRILLLAKEWGENPKEVKKGLREHIENCTDCLRNYGRILAKKADMMIREAPMPRSMRRKIVLELDILGFLR